MSTSAFPREVREVLGAGGTAGALMREIDWSASPVGAPETWPQSLRTAVSICLSSRFPMLIWWGADLVMVYNDAYTPILGDKHPRSMGQAGRECWPEIWDTIGPMLHGVMSGEGATYSEDQLLMLERHGYPEECYFTFSYSPIRDESGGVGGVFTAVTETTGRVLGERRLATLQALAAGTAEQRTAVGVLEAAAGVLARRSSDVPFAVLFLAESGAPRTVAASGLLAGPEGVEDRLRAAAQVALTEHRQVELDGLDLVVGGLAVDRAQVLPVEAGDVGAAVVVGISPRRPFDDDYRAFFGLLAGQIGTAMADALAYEAAQARAEALAELDAAKTTFFSNVSHEFRTPLTLMLGPCEDALADTAEPLPAVQRERVELVHRNALRLLKLVNTLLDFSRLESGRLTASYQPVDLAALTVDLASMFRSAVEKAGLTLRVDCAPLPEPAYVDRDMWERIVLNLLSNAVKFTFEGEIAVTLRAEDGAAVLTVADTGVGIDPTEQLRLFERFHRVRGVESRSHEGSGIGLALVAELTALHGGQVEVASTPGQGSAFTVRLPLGAAHLPPDQVVEQPPAEAVEERAHTDVFVTEATRWVGPEAGVQVPPRGDGGVAEPDTRVLVVDDNADMRDYLAAVLAQTYTVQTAADGIEALERMRESVPDLVVTDVMMPRLDGAGLVAAVRPDPHLAHVPVVMLSARAGEEATVAGLATGADDYLVKPFNVRELRARVRANLELDRTRRARDHYLRMLDDFPSLVWRTDTEGRCDYVNNAWLRFTGRELAAELSRGWLEGVHPDDRPAFREALRRAALTRESFEHRFRLRHRSGAWRWVLDVAQPVHDLSGRFVGLIGSGLDVTERHEAEQARRAAAAVEEAAAREHRLAVQLQRSLLPTVLVRPEDLEVAVCYRAGVAGTVVGGDWYDVVELGAGRTALVIGDVMGRGLHAAAVMGQLRAAVRAYARLDLPPADVLELLDGVVRDLDQDHIVTCLYAVYDPADRALTYASAGHPPPLLREPGGSVRRLGGVPWPPLGTRLPTLREERVTLPEGALLALYTDGLVERRGQDLDDGIDLLADLLAATDLPLQEMPDAVVARLRPAGEEDDDIALLLTRVGGRHAVEGAGPLVVAVPASGRAVHETRDQVAQALASWDVPRTVADEVVLAASELVTNAVLHGRPPIELRMRRSGTEVVLEVRDCATLMPRRLRPGEEDEHGRGLQLVAALADRWGARPMRGGKAVWCVFDLDEA